MISKVKEKIGTSTSYLVKYDKIQTRIIRNGQNWITTSSILKVSADLASKIIEYEKMVLEKMY